MKQIALRIATIMSIVLVVFNVSVVSAQSLDSNQSQTLQLGRSGILWFDSGTVGSCNTTTSSVNLVGGDNEQKAFNFFLSQGLNNVQAAAVVGNLMDESGMDPTILQKGGDSQNPNDAGTNPNNDGWGIAQWSPGGKIIGIAQSLNITTPIYDLATQLNIVWQEMIGTAPTGYKNVTQGLKQINDLAQAVTFFQKNFESGVSGRRQTFAQQALQLYGSSASATTASSTSSSSGTAYDGGCNTSISCNNISSTNAATNISSSNLSATRQSVVCLAEQELKLWESQPGYPHTSFSATSFLKYTDGWYEEWCADFVSWIYAQAGYSFSGGQAGGWMLAGVSEIESLGIQNQKFHWHPASSGYVPKPGDIAIHGGNHVNIFISSTGGVSTYIGGDQGSGPYGHTPPLAPGSPTPNPPSGSIVSTDIEQGYYSGGITGYVSPD